VIDVMPPDPPINTPLLIYAPDILGPRWHFAMRTEIRGRKGLRWKIFGWDGERSVKIPFPEFRPIDWLPLEPTIN